MRSDAHNALQDWLIELYRARGLIAIKEYYMNGKKIDVLSQDILSRHTVANEIEFSPKHAVENIVRDLQAGCDQVRVFAVNTSVLTQIQNKAMRVLDNETLSKVAFYLIDDFFPIKTTKTPYRIRRNLIRKKSGINRGN